MGGERPQGLLQVEPLTHLSGKVAICQAGLAQLASAGTYLSLSHIVCVDRLWGAAPSTKHVETGGVCEAEEPRAQ